MRTLAMLWLPLLAGCGAMLTPGRFEVVVVSQPPGASVLHEGKEVGVTPCTVAVSRDSRELELRRLGYHAQRVDVGTERNPWVAGNAVTLGLGMLVDEVLGTTVNPITQPLVMYLAPEHGPVRPPWRRKSAAGWAWPMIPDAEQRLRCKNATARSPISFHWNPR